MPCQASRVHRYITGHVHPVITGAANQTITLPSGTRGPVSYQRPTASDNSGTVTLTCVPASGSTMSVGSVTVTCTAVDPSGNAATASFVLTVRSVTVPATGGGGLPILPWAFASLLLGAAMLAATRPNRYTTRR